MAEPTADELATRTAAFFAKRAELRERRRQLTASAGKMERSLFDRAKAQFDEERRVWRAEGEDLRRCLEEREKRKATLGYDPDFIQEPEREFTMEEILAEVDPRHWHDTSQDADGWIGLEDDEHPSETAGEVLRRIPPGLFDGVGWPSEGSDESDG